MHRIFGLVPLNAACHEATFQTTSFESGADCFTRFAFTRFAVAALNHTGLLSSVVLVPMSARRQLRICFKRTPFRLEDSMLKCVVCVDLECALLCLLVCGCDVM